MALVASLCLAVPAYASSGTKVIADCNAHNMLTRHYTIPQLQNALSTMPADVAEYTNCHDVIQRALLTQEGKLHAGGGSPASSGASSGGSFLPTPLIVVLVVLVLAAATFGALALRRRRGLS